jgi:hypothetical protein
MNGTSTHDLANQVQAKPMRGGSLIAHACDLQNAKSGEPFKGSPQVSTGGEVSMVRVRTAIIDSVGQPPACARLV